MPKKRLQDGSKEKTETASADQGVPLQKMESPVFYRCTCPECGEDTLELCGLGVFYRAKFLGVTDAEEFGCGSMQLGGEYEWEIECSSCGYRVFDKEGVTLDSLLQWAVNHGKVMRTLEFGFVCPVCGSPYLERIERASRSVRAVYEIEGNSEAEAHAEVALSFEQVLEGGESVRYCCRNKHELANEDGIPVKTAEELVEWLKARQPQVSGQTGQPFE